MGDLLSIAVKLFVHFSLYDSIVFCVNNFNKVFMVQFGLSEPLGFRGRMFLTTYFQRKNYFFLTFIVLS